MYYFDNEEVEILYKVITNLLNKQYRSELLEIEEVKNGKFVVERDPESGEYSIIFVWWNDFGLRGEESMERIGNEIQNKVMPKTRHLSREVRGISDMIEPENDKYFFDVKALHQFKRENFENLIEDGEIYY